MKFKKLLAAALCAVMTMSLFSGCGKDDEKKFVITLYPDTAPLTCENFQTLVEDKFYDGLTFHRVVEDFMAQGGDPKADGTGGSGKTLKGEFLANDVENTLAHTRGVVSMARSQDYDSASSQFFICFETNSKTADLDGNYAAFGLVTEGMEVVDGFLDIPRVQNGIGEESAPETEIKIVSAKMIDKDNEGNPRVEFVVEY